MLHHRRFLKFLSIVGTGLVPVPSIGRKRARLFKGSDRESSTRASVKVRYRPIGGRFGKTPGRILGRGLLAWSLAVFGPVGCAVANDAAAPLKQRPNRLIGEKSPYLLQHAYNPVDWYPWGEEAFARARKENRLVFLSVGYSTCYWCHVMEREVFEHTGIAALMNQYFINIKVDREERPDVDRIYMNALQAMTGRGGWPMSMFLTPNLKPFYGGSYIPADRFESLIQSIHNAWSTEPKSIKQSSTRITEVLKKATERDAETESKALDTEVLQSGYTRILADFDPVHAGFGSRPKFPRPVVFNFLLRYYLRSEDSEALDMTVATLRKIGDGGIHDHLGGGFHRYSVDRQWRVPHFEKMIYDQAQLVLSFMEAYQITGERAFREIVTETLQYVAREMTGPGGGFYSAEDAESATDPKDPREKQEGAFYVWKLDEIQRVLGLRDARVFSFVYGMQGQGNALEDPHKVFTDKNILYMAQSTDAAAVKFELPAEEIRSRLTRAREKLFAARQSRVRPHLDDKILTSWNGLMISAFARAAAVFGDPKYLERAERAGVFVWNQLYDPERNRLLRRYREGDARFEATLQDYAFLVSGFLDLYESSLQVAWLKKAVLLTESQNKIFFDSKDGVFFDTSGEDRSLLFRTREDYDGAEPSGNSVAARNLLRLAEMTNKPAWRHKAEQILEFFGTRLRRHPQAMPELLAALDFYLQKPLQIIIAGPREREDTRAMRRELHREFIPNKIVLLVDGADSQQFLGRSLPFIRELKRLEGKATVYVCQDYACQLPTNDMVRS